jgi:hypothetical protein
VSDLRHYRPGRPGQTFTITAPGLAVAERAAVTPKIGYPFILDHISVYLFGSAAIECNLQLWLAQDNDLTGAPLLTGQPIYTPAGEPLTTFPTLPSFPQNFPQSFNPRAVQPIAGTYIKTFVANAAGARAYLLQLDILPLD